MSKLLETFVDFVKGVVAEHGNVIARWTIVLLVGFVVYKHGEQVGRESVNLGKVRSEARAEAWTEFFRSNEAGSVGAARVGGFCYTLGAKLGHLNYDQLLEIWKGAMPERPPK